MQHAQHRPAPLFKEVEELLETAAFSLETVRMALTIGQRSEHDFLTLDQRVQSVDTEEREAGAVALEALDTARGAWLDLAELLDEPERVGLGYEIRFWSTFEWCWTRLFTEPVRSTGQGSLRHELIEACIRILDLQEHLARARGESVAKH